MPLRRSPQTVRNLVLLILLGVATAVQAANGDTLRIVGFTAYANPTWQFPIGGPEKKWLRYTQAFVFGGELHFGALPCDSDAFAEDYNYPTLSLGAKLALNNGVTMRRTADPLWGKLVPVDYDSHLGDIFTLYGAFSRPLLRRGRWQVDYSLRAGVGYGPHIYNRTDNIDNELIGSRFTIFFGAGLLASCRISSQWALTAGILYGHHSNGALDRPNKGENHVGPVVGLRYAPRQLDLPQRAPSPLRPFRRYWYADLRLGFGGKTLLEDWQKTQYQTDPSDPDYRTDHFRFYTAYSLQASLMCRYARRWASGLGLDLYYGSYYKRVRDLDRAAGETCSHSPWSVGISAKHEVYYHNLSLNMALGLYLYRQMGAGAKAIEQPYYERIGVYYTFPRLAGLRIGASVNAHFAKADITEFIVGIPFRLSAAP